MTQPDDQDITHYFGLAKVDVLAPRGLYRPVLPHRSGGKLTFPLCRACVAEEMTKPLLQRSYQCPQRRRGLFAEYVNTWLRLKQESYGYPSWAQTPQQKSAFVEQYCQREGISLDPDQIVKNPGRKATSKLSLNAFWGKFGENLLKSITYAISDPADLYALVSNPFININAVRVCTEDKLEVVVTPLKQELQDNGKINIFIAAFTTCHARLRLYTHLKTLVIGRCITTPIPSSTSGQPGQTEIPLGDYLGEMTDELEGGDFIVDFTSAGPKNYGYHTHRGKVCCKVRGFSLNNTRGQQQLNYDIM